MNEPKKWDTMGEAELLAKVSRQMQAHAMREFADTVEFDEEDAPEVRQAFERYVAASRAFQEAGQFIVELIARRGKEGDVR